MKSFRDYFDIEEINKEFTRIINYNGMSIPEMQLTIEEFKKYDVDYENSIQIVKIPERFNELYTDFVNDLSSLDKLRLATEVDIENYYEDDNTKFLKLLLYATYLTNERKSLYLLISEENSELKVTAFDTRYIHEKHKINMTERRQRLFKQYMDLFTKHKELISMYYNLKFDNNYRSSCLNNGIVCAIDFDIDNYWDMYNGLEDVCFYIRINDSYIKVSFKLGSNLRIKYSDCEFNYNNEFIKMPNKAYDELINEIYISKECLTKRGISLDNGFQRKKH